MSEPTVGSARIDLHVAGDPGDAAARAVGVGEKRPRKGALRVKPVREFTVYAVGEGSPITPVRADTVSTLGDWLTLTLGGHEVFGAPRERVLQYTAAPVEEAA